MASVTPPDPLPPDENSGPTLLAISGLLIALILISSSLRIFVRYANGALGLDDYTIAVVAVLCVVRFAVQVVQVNSYGNGRHRWFISHDDYVTNNMLGWYAQVLLFATMCLLKMSICLLLLRIKKERGLKIFIYCLMAGLFVTNFGCILILLAQCRPISVYWTGGGGECWDTRVRIYYIYFTIAYSLLTDIICSLMPWVVVWKVRIPLARKIAVCGLMGMGIVATGFGILRATSLGLVTNDLSWAYCIAAIWSNLELFLGVIAANLAISRSMYRYFRYGKDGTSSSQSRTAGGYSDRLGYTNQNSFIHDPFEAAATVATASGRRHSIPKSDSSDIPLEPGIHKKTSFAVREEYQEPGPTPG